ncbi:hypothetical protein HK102_006150, partial [Quaeritorhiza haematococci]
MEASNSLVIKQFQDLNIQIYGTHEEPLFKAKDIGDLLEIDQIRKTIQNLDDEDKILIGGITVTGTKGQYFLTENGVYEVLFISRKPLAKQFKKWVKGIIKDIRLTGQYQLQKEVKESKAKLIEFQVEKVAIEARALEAEAAKQEAEAKAAEEQKRRKELEDCMRSKKYEPVVKDEFVYAMKESAELHNNKHKIGKTINISNRKSNFQTSYASKSRSDLRCRRLHDQPREPFPPPTRSLLQK